MQHEPQTEFSDLARGLRRHVRRRLLMGQRRTPRWQAPPISREPVSREPLSREPLSREPLLREPLSREPLVREPAAREPLSREPDPPTRELATRELATRELAARELAPRNPEAPQAWGDTPTLKDESERRAAILTERAAGAGDLEALATEVAQCTACGLCQSRTQTVFMDGRGSAGVLFVGEAPGFHEDRQGVPFVGQAGELLTDIIQKGMKLRREEVSIANVLKCRPPENRDPLPAEKRLCTIWLDRQIELLNPRVLIALGRHAAGHLLGSDASMGRLRGKVWERDGRKVVPTYHPAFLLRSPQFKRECWQDIQLAMGELHSGDHATDPGGNRGSTGR